MTLSAIQMPLSIAIGVVGLLYCVAYATSWRLYIRRLRKESSRFRLFEARADLVELVARGDVSETDSGWRIAYEAVNNMLSMHEKFDALSVSLRMVKMIVAEKRDESQRKFHDRAARRIQSTEKRVPAFAEVREKIGRAFVEMMFERTTFAGKVSLWGILQLARFVAFVTGGTEARRSLDRTVRDTSSATGVARWGGPECVA
jgi:hypothetical protein